MTIQQAIVKAYSAGWRPKAYPNMKPKNITEDTAHALWYSLGDGFFLDPLFWQFLGKGLGNKDEMRCSSKHCDQKQCSYAGYKDPKLMFDNFHDSIWYGGTPESFFEKL